MNDSMMGKTTTPALSTPRRSSAHLRLRILHDAQEPLQKPALAPLVQARSVVEQPFDMHEESIRPVQRYRVRVKPVYICAKSETLVSMLAAG